MRDRRTGEAELEGLDPEQLLGVGAHLPLELGEWKRRGSSVRVRSGAREGRARVWWECVLIRLGRREQWGGSEGNLAGKEQQECGVVGVVLGGETSAR